MMNRHAFSFIAVMAILQILVMSGCGVTERPEKPDIILVLLDSVRADHMSCYGYQRNTTPVMDSLAAHGAMWTNVQAQSSWTLPAMASILTGLSPRSHYAGCHDGEFYGIDPTLFTIPLMLKRRAGYQTAAIFNSDLMSEKFAFDAGFDYFDCMGIMGKRDLRDAHRTVNEFLSWYDSDRDPQHPLFAALHFNDPHMPYSPPPPYDTLYADPKCDPVFNRKWGTRNDVQRINDGDISPDQRQLDILTGLYDSEISYVDSQLGYLLRQLSDRGSLDNTIFVIISDNGEEFGEHGGFGHGRTLYQEVLGVPLIISGSGIDVAIIDEPAAQYDILPTLLGLLDIEEPIWAEGEDLFAEQSQGSRYIQSSDLLWSSQDLQAIRLDNRVIIGNPDNMVASLYDLESDPLQQNPMTPSRDSRDELYYHWSLEPRGNPQQVLFRGEPEPSFRDLGYIR